MIESKYIYGIIAAPEERLFNSYRRNICEGVYTIPYQDISAIISDSQFVDYTNLPKHQIARYLLSHQQVIEKIMDSYTIIPMKLGTYAFNIKEVEEILNRGYQTLKDMLMKINNKIEMDVVATWNDLNSVIKEIGKGQEIKELKEKLISKSEGVSLEDQIKIGGFIKNILDKNREKLASEIGDILGKASIGSRVHGLIDDRMIFNAAFLIDKDKKAEFEGRLDDLNELYDKKIDFRCVGPLPTYSFYTVEVKKISFEDIEWARGKLRLNNMATKDEIIKAYRNKANLHHPDKNAGSMDAERQFNEISRAYKILLECSDGDADLFNEANRRHNDSKADENNLGEFSSENHLGQNAIIVKIKEQHMRQVENP